MFFNFDSPAFRGFDIRTALPKGYRGAVLSGSEVVTATGERGMIIMQTLIEPAFEIRYAVLDVLRPLKLAAEQQAAHLVSFFAIKNHLRYTLKGLPRLQLQQGQFAFLHTQGQEIVTHYDKRQEYQHLEIAWSRERLQPGFHFFQVLLPLFSEAASRQSFFLPLKNREAAYPGFDLAQELLRAPYQEELNRVYFEYKVMEYLIYLLSRAEQDGPPSVYLTDEERQRLINIGIAVSQHPDKKFPINLLALQAHMNVMKLKMGFKQIHGQGIFQHQLAARMHEAHRLLRETDLTTKAVAMAVGYQLTTSFINRFQEFFGYAPGKVSRKR